MTMTMTRIGVPTAGVFKLRLRPAADAVNDDPDLELRPGETELGRPPQVPGPISPRLTRRKSRAQAARRGAGREGHRRGRMLLASDPTGLGWLGWFGSPLAFAVLLWHDRRVRRLPLQPDDARF